MGSGWEVGGGFCFWEEEGFEFVRFSLVISLLTDVGQLLATLADGCLQEIMMYGFPTAFPS